MALVEDEDYEYLNSKIDNRLVKYHLKYKTYIINGERKKIKSIQLNELESLGLSEEEIPYVMNYLKKQDIYVSGIFQATYSIFDNYIICPYKFKESSVQQIDLNEATQMKLFEAYKNTGNKEIRNTLFFSYVKLAKNLAEGYATLTGIEASELESYAYEGIITALDSYNDNDNGCKLITYINNSIKFKILFAIHQEYRICESSKIRDLNNARESLRNEYAWDDSYDEYEHIDEIIEKFVDDNSSYMVKNRDIQTVNLLYSDSLDSYENDIAASDNNTLYNETIEKVYQKELKQDILKAIKQMPPIDAYIIVKNFGLDGNEQMLLKQIAKELNISPQSVGQHEKKALKYLKEHCKFLEKHIENGYISHEFDYDPTGIRYEKVKKTSCNTQI